LAPIIDMHLHLAVRDQIHPWVLEYRRQMLKGDVKAYEDRYSTPHGLEMLLDQCGVDYGVVLAGENPVTTGTVRTEQVVEFCRNSRKLIPFATVNPFLVARPAGEIERYVVELGCRGVKLYPTYQHFYPNDPMIYPIYAKAEALGVPIMLHTGSSVFRGSRLKYGDPIYLDDVAVDFPNLTIIMAHSGRGFWYDRAFFLARLHENVYMEISGLPPQKLLSYFPEFERNADKILYGSDWPGMPHIGRNIRLVRSLPLKQETKEKVLGGNAAKILGLST